ncbi:MAG TPA: zf-HC2 domain-containing protein [Pyrinomonadaceae bacterium]|nr:zf-HC2 domain-containing protein [Pyrinomonadaceae bacterium]
MSDTTNSPVCERSSDLMAFLYNEMNASELRQFESHLRECRNCREEAASFGMVRESISTWRDEVLTGFVPSTATPARKSALAAFRQFFDLSPLWLQSAAVVLTCCVIFGSFVFFYKRDNTFPPRTDARYTEQDVKQLVDEALAKQKAASVAVDNTQQTLAAVDPLPSKRQAKQPTKDTARNRRPLSRAEREQLAADLRLLPTDDDLDLLGDRINDEEKR